MWQQYRCVCTYARSKPKPLFSTVRGVRVTEFSRTDQRCPFKSSGRTPPVCLCVCVFHYNDPKHSVYAATRALLLRSWIYNFPCGRKRHKICLELFLKVTVVLQNSLQCISTHSQVTERMIRPLSARNEELDKVETTRSRAWRSFGAVSVDGKSSTCGVFRATVTVVNGVFIAAWLSGRGGGLILDNCVYVRVFPAQREYNRSCTELKQGELMNSSTTASFVGCFLGTGAPLKTSPGPEFGDQYLF